MAGLFDSPAARPAPELACVDVPALPLQVVLRGHPGWREDPVVIVEDDRPFARILRANRAARGARIRSGIRFSEAQSLVPRLHAVPVAEVDTESAADEIFAMLLTFSPRVEPVPEDPGVFWMDPRGLGRLYDSHAAWAERVLARVESRGLVASVALGWRRASLLALARAGRGARVLAGPDEEQGEADRAPLERLGASLELQRALRVLGIGTVGELRALPAGGVGKRLGEEAAALHDFVCGRTWTPLRPRVPSAPVRAEIPVDPPDDDRTRLLFAIKGALHGLARKLRSRSEGIRALGIGLRLDHAPAHEERIETAAPTLDVARLIDLVRLRLSSAELAAPVELVEIDVESRPVRPAQIAVLDTPPRRDPAAAMAALARVKAALGAASVARARLVDAHLPEARFRWEPVGEIVPPRPAEPDGLLPLVRALLAAPRPLPDPPRHERERWLGSHGAVVAMHGPDRVAAGWWSRPAHRDYFLVETRPGEILWTFLDRTERAWYLHGCVD